MLAKAYIVYSIMYRLHSFILLFVYVCFPTNLFCLVLSSTLYAVVEKYNTNNLFCDKGHTAIQTKKNKYIDKISQTKDNKLPVSIPVWGVGGMGSVNFCLPIL